MALAASVVVVSAEVTTTVWEQESGEIVETQRLESASLFERAPVVE